MLAGLMIALHAIWWHSVLHLWGECAGEEDGDAGRATASGGDPSFQPIPHPNAAAPTDLHAAAGDLSPDGLLASIVDERAITLWLPCVDGVPVPSREAGPLSTEAAALRRVRVPTLVFPAADTIDLLAGVTDRRLEAGSGSLAYWARLARFVLALLARQQFVPDLDASVDGGFAAWWQVFVNEPEEIAWLRRVAAAMPPVCRAVASDEARPADATRILDNFLIETADAVIRRALSNDRFFRQVQERAEKEPHWELRWLWALLGEDRTVRAEAEETFVIAARVRSWIGQLEEKDSEPAPRLCLRLTEPDETGGAPADDWRLRFELRSPDDDTLIDIRQVWSEQAGAPSVLGRHFVGRREHLLAELTRAAQMVPRIETALKTGPLAVVHLSTAEAHAFIREQAPLLQAQGFGVSLPEWAAEGERHLGLRLFVRPVGEQKGDSELSLGSVGLNSLLAFDWRVALGDEQLSVEAFEALTAQNAPLVRFHGQWIGLDHAEARTAVQFMRRGRSGRLTLAEAIRIAHGAEEIDSGLPILGLSGTDWVDQLLRESPTKEIEAVEQPPNFSGMLRPYQLRGLAWLAFLDRLGIGGCLADDMGLGKTIQLIALLLHERRDGVKVGPTLLFAPMSVVGNWHREVQRFAKSLRVLVHRGPDRLAGEGFVKAAREHDLVITTYGLAQRDLRDLGRVPWHRITLDEAQKIKNPSAKQTIAIRSLPGALRVALTGTPLENHLSELWSIMEMLNPGLLGSAAGFRRRFALPIEKMGDQQRAAQLRRMIRPFTLRRVKGDPNVACDLPEKMEMRVFCNLMPEQAALYERTVNEMLGEVERTDGIRRRGLILATLTKLKQICNHPAHFLKTDGPLNDRSGKCERLVEMLEEALDEGDEALVFTQFRKMGDLLQRMLAERLRLEIPFLHGGTPAKRRDEMILDFQDPNSPARIFLLSLRAGGFGLNLTRANHVFHFDRWWNPAVESQATDRSHRIGQTRRVQVHKFVCIGTLEDRIDRLLAEKSALADQILGGGDEWLTGLSTEDLRSYLMLSPEAAAE